MCEELGGLGGEGEGSVVEVGAVVVSHIIARVTDSRLTMHPAYRPYD